MKVVVFASTKGGVGKSTLCFNVAIKAAQKHSVYLADVDPQLSLATMHERRGELTNPRLLTRVKNVSESVRLLSEAYARDFLFVDTPGSMMGVIRDAMLAADCIVLPVQPSKVDWLAQEAVADLLDDMGLTDRALFVVNRAESKDPMAEEARHFFSSRTKHPILTIRRRPEYVVGFDRGQAGIEASNAAATEIGALWNAIRDVLEPKREPEKAAPRRKPGKLQLDPTQWENDNVSR
jgi:chromosome partitioning protein